jgi:hypothetical protein
VTTEKIKLNTIPLITNLLITNSLSQIFIFQMKKRENQEPADVGVGRELSQEEGSVGRKRAARVEGRRCGGGEESAEGREAPWGGARLA